MITETETIKKIALKYNKTPAQICIKWCLQRGLIVILNSFNPEHILENAKVISSFYLKLDISI